MPNLAANVEIVVELIWKFERQMKQICANLLDLHTFTKQIYYSNKYLFVQNYYNYKPTFNHFYDLVKFIEKLFWIARIFHLKIIWKTNLEIWLQIFDKYLANLYNKFVVLVSYLFRCQIVNSLAIPDTKYYTFLKL